MASGRNSTLITLRQALQAGIFALFGTAGCTNSKTPVTDGAEAVYMPVASFNFYYHFNPSPGLRTWSLDSSNRWHERYPDGTESVFDKVRRGSLSGCSGSVATHSSEPNFHVFVPDLGCPRMVAFFIGDDGHWKMLGKMENIR